MACMVRGLISLNTSSSNMKRFILTLLSLSFLFIGVVIVLHLWTIWRLQPEVDKMYELSDDQDVLFVGSSEVGCGILEAPRFHNKVLWISSTSTESFLMRIKELERRNQLAGVKLLVVPFNYTQLPQQTEPIMMWAWYEELAVSWRYLSDAPFSMLSFFPYIMSNLRWPLALHVKDSPRDGLPALSGRSARYQSKMRKIIVDDAKISKDYRTRAFRGWERCLDDAFRQMREICRSNNIELVVFRVPLLDYYWDAVPSNVKADEQEWLEKIRGMGLRIVEIPGRYGEDVCYDGRHFTRKGARIITELLYEELGLSLKD